MPPTGGVSFRILSPEPLDFSRPSSFPHELSLAAEFSSKAPALKLQRFLKNHPQVRFVKLIGKKSVQVLWVMGFRPAQTLPSSLKVFPELAAQIKTGMTGYLKATRPSKTRVMGVLNITPDSFSDGGRFLDPAQAVEQALQMQEEGADWVDVGGESTRPGARPVTSREEKERVIPVIKVLSKVLRIPVSIDTYKAEVARAAVGEGARMVNDIGALGLDSSMGKTLARLKVPVVLMHMKGKPRTMQKKPVYRDLMGELTSFFRERLRYAAQCGIRQDRIWIDPGFGFGKTPRHNIELTRRLWELTVLGRPLLLGPSRKSTLGWLLGGVSPEDRVEATGAAVTAAVLKGVDMVRVHDVKAAVRVVKIADAIRTGRGSPKP